MKTLLGQTTENAIEVLGFEVLSSTEMNEVRGGSRPKTHDMDALDVTDD